jgi:hypothetical protein
MTIAEDTPVKPITKPTERSMPPVMMTKALSRRQQGIRRRVIEDVRSS